VSVILVLLAALGAGDWQCTEVDGLWDCRAPRADVERETAAAPASAPATPAARQAPDAGGPSGTLPGPGSETGVETGKAPAVEPPPAEPAAATPGAPPADAYVVQVGAYRDKAAAQREARRLDDERLVILPTRRDGEDWFVVLLGAYAGYGEADSVGRAYEEATGGSYWVRKASSLRAVLSDN
jgi:septal ring-binding cell division protein DamX